MVDDWMNSGVKSGPCGAWLNGGQLPMQCMEVNRQSEISWLRLAGLVKGRRRLDCLERALQINPRNKQTLRLMERLSPKRAYRAVLRLQEQGDEKVR
jgi:hypothetical protein